MRKVRDLSASDLGLVSISPPPPVNGSSTGTVAEADVAESLISDEDPIYQRVLALLEDGYGGVILRGVPGTSKTWYAREIALKMVDHDAKRVEFVQFHPSYQYEDFIEGYVPDASSGFRLKKKHFLRVCDRAAGSPPGTKCVVVIDELSRCDPVRVFGELLTYIESTRRDMEVRLASGRRVRIPPNVVIIATMNEFDRGVDEIDAALERRLGSITLDPDPNRLAEILQKNGVDQVLSQQIGTFFSVLQQHPNPRCRVGHAYFRSVRDRESLDRLWESQLRFVLRRAFPLDDDGFDDLATTFGALFRSPPPLPVSLDEP